MTDRKYFKKVGKIISNPETISICTTNVLTPLFMRRGGVSLSEFCVSESSLRLFEC